MLSPANYDKWYRTSRGSWIAEHEFGLMTSLMRPAAGESLLDVGCGTGHFSRRFAGIGLNVTGIDPDQEELEFARQQRDGIDYVSGSAEQLDFADESFDYVTAVTSLCFVSRPEKALLEMWRVCRKGVMLGLLNRNSLLYRERENHPGYIGARWDTAKDVRHWIRQAGIHPIDISSGTAITFPAGRNSSRIMEKIIPLHAPWGSFLAVYLSKDSDK